MNYGDMLKAAMEVRTQAEADATLKELVEVCLASKAGATEAEALRIQKSNLGYFAGYYDDETRGRVERLYQCAHPVFGAIAANGAPTPKQAFDMGVRMGEQLAKKGQP